MFKSTWPCLKSVTKRLAESIPSHHRQKLLSDGSIFIDRTPGAISSKLQGDLLPPPLKAITEKKYHLTAVERAEMTKLRLENPDVWTRNKLAERFNCSPLYVSFVVEASEERRARLQQKLEEKLKWFGYKKRQIRLNRKRRRALW